MIDIEGRISAIESELSTQKPKTPDKLLQQLNDLEEHPEIEMAHFLRIEELRQAIIDSFKGERQSTENEAKPDTQIIERLLVDVEKITATSIDSPEIDFYLQMITAECSKIFEVPAELQNRIRELTEEIAHARRNPQKIEPERVELSRFTGDTSKHTLDKTEKNERRRSTVQEIRDFDLEAPYSQMLGISVGASVEEIRAALGVFQKKFHPDTLRSLEITDAGFLAKGEEIFKKITEAASILESIPMLLEELSQIRDIETITEILLKLVKCDYEFTYSVRHARVTFDGKKMTAIAFCALIADAYSKIEGDKFPFDVALDKIPPILGLDRKLRASLRAAAGPRMWF